jgi:hypothetical protein
VANLLKEMFGEPSRTEKQEADDLDADDEEGAEPLAAFMNDAADEEPTISMMERNLNRRPAITVMTTTMPTGSQTDKLLAFSQSSAG